MKIDNNTPLLKAVPDSPAPLAAKNASMVNRASAELSNATKLGEASATSLLPSTTGDFDAAKVAKIRSDISSGNYKVNPEKLADALLNSVRDLLRKNNK